MPETPSTVDVLVVDDDRSFVAELIASLGKAGLMCASASDPWQALHLMAEGVRPAVILVDIRMPELNGLELARKLTPMITPQRPEIIFVSGCAVLENAIEAMRLGAYDLLAKPIDLRRLIQAIKYILLMRRVPHESHVEQRITDYPAIEELHKG